MDANDPAKTIHSEAHVQPYTGPLDLDNLPGVTTAHYPCGHSWDVPRGKSVPGRCPRCAGVVPPSPTS